MNGADLMFEEASNLGIDICFANPGTTEMPMVAALDRAPAMRAVLSLHENVCTGAADGYARIAGKPASTILHLGPGLANGLANLHNARRAFSPLINFVGEHASWHISADAPLNSDIESFARPVSNWVRRVMSPSETARDMAEAYNSAIAKRGSISTLIIPHDHQLAEAERRPFRAKPAENYGTFDEQTLRAAGSALKSARTPLLLLGGNALFGEGLEAAGRLAKAFGADLAVEVGFAKLETGQGRPPLKRLPYFPELAQAFLDQYDTIIVCGTKMPVSFFGYHDQPSRYLDNHPRTIHLANQQDDAATALQALSADLAAPQVHFAKGPLPTAPQSGDLSAEIVGQVLTALQPEDAIVVVTAVTSAHAYTALAPTAAAHTQLALTGGAIGDGPALSLGAALAAPGKRVINLEADGSGAYIVQALWTHVRENLDITTIICANRKYHILELELQRAGINNPGPKARRLCDLGDPPLDWVALAKGFGMDAIRVEDAATLSAALSRSLATPGPFLIEALI